ncbi:hypothetical protein E2986_13077 [Frieseomelitta varia]|uniref:Uncharacterized protein n=1 Tax=Frieseomelitta varia TaxID=561572 RepID=A0A833RNW7_9HYME|nr:hypothetical protein E2986_13077 [Frieseomelitta varia]
MFVHKQRYSFYYPPSLFATDRDGEEVFNELYADVLSDFTFILNYEIIARDVIASASGYLDNALRSVSVGDGVATEVEAEGEEEEEELVPGVEGVEVIVW